MTKKKFEAFLKIRNSGVTNMMVLTRVVELSNGELTKEDCIDIIKNFGKYIKEYKIKEA